MPSIDSRCERDEVGHSVCGLTLEWRTLWCLGCGGRWVYGVCTDVLGAVAEKVTGLRFDQFMQERILGKQSCLDCSHFMRSLGAMLNLCAVLVMYRALGHGRHGVLGTAREAQPIRQSESPGNVMQHAALSGQSRDGPSAV